MKVAITVNRKVFISLFFCILFSIVVALIPWWNLRKAPYYDRENYIYFIDVVPSKLDWFDFSGVIVKLMNEWGWHKFLQIMSVNFELISSQILFIVTFLCVFTTSIFLSKRYHFLSFLLLLNPIFIDFSVSQLRLAFAMSFILIGYWVYSRKNYLYIPILLATPFIHTSAVFFIFIIGTALILSKIDKIPVKIKTIISILVGLVTSIVTGPLMSQILTQLEDRRAEYNDMSAPLLYTIFWLILYSYFLVKGFLEKSQRQFPFYITISVLSMVFFNSFMIGYSTRFLAACFPFIIAAMIETEGKEKSLIFLSYMVFTVLLWFFWFT